MKSLPIVELYLIKSRIIKEGYQSDPLFEEVCSAIKEKELIILEDTEDFEISETTSAVGGPCVSGGSGAVVSSQPSGLAGATIGTNWSSGGGTTGSGDISIPYNPSGSNRMSQKIPVQMGSNHGSRTGKKTRKKRMTLKTMQQLRNTIKQKQDHTKTGEPKSKVMDFDDFQKASTNKIKK